MMLVKVPSNRTNALKESLNQLKGVSASIMETEPPAIGDLARPAIACTYHPMDYFVTDILMGSI
jgi:hypothetical protein